MTATACDSGRGAVAVTHLLRRAASDAHESSRGRKRDLRRIDPVSQILTTHGWTRPRGAEYCDYCSYTDNQN